MAQVTGTNLETEKTETLELIEDIMSLHGYTHSLLEDFEDHLGQDGKKLWGKKNYEKLSLFFKEGFKLLARAKVLVASYSGITRDELADVSTMISVHGTIDAIAKVLRPFADQVRVALVDINIQTTWTSAAIEALQHLSYGWKKVDIRANLIHRKAKLAPTTQTTPPVESTSTTTSPEPTTTNVATTLSPEDIDKLISEITTGNDRPKANARKTRRGNQQKAMLAVTTTTSIPTTTTTTTTTSSTNAPVDTSGDDSDEFIPVVRNRAKGNKRNNGPLPSSAREFVGTKAKTTTSPVSVTASEKLRLSDTISTTETKQSEQPTYLPPDLTTTMQPTRSPAPATRGLSPYAPAFVPPFVIERPIFELVARDLFGMTQVVQQNMEYLRNICAVALQNAPEQRSGEDAQAYMDKLMEAINAMEELRIMSQNAVTNAQSLQPVFIKPAPQGTI